MADKSTEASVAEFISCYKFLLSALFMADAVPSLKNISETNRDYSVINEYIKRYMTSFKASLY